MGGVWHRHPNQRFVDPTGIHFRRRRPTARRKANPYLGMPARERRQFVPEGEVGFVPRRVHERHAARRFGEHRMPQHAHERSDADAPRKQRERAVIVSRVGEAACGRTYGEEAARPETCMQRIGDEALPLDRDLEVPRGGRWRTDRVAPHQFPAIRADPDGEELSRPEVEAIRPREAEGTDVRRLVQHAEYRHLDEACRSRRPCG